MYVLVLMRDTAYMLILPEFLVTLQIVEDLLEVIDEVQVWPTNVTREGSSQ